MQSLEELEAEYLGVSRSAYIPSGIMNDGGTGF